jgi:hypothetical protein
MIVKPALAAMIASGFIVPETPKLIFPKPSIVKAENLEFSKHMLLGMPLTLGMIPKRAFVGFANRGSGTLSDNNTSWSVPFHGNSIGPNVFRNSGKWYMEVTVGQFGQLGFIGIVNSSYAFNSHLGFNTFTYGYSGATGNLNFNASAVKTGGSTFATGAVLGVAFDLGALRLYVARNNVWQFSGNPSAGTGGQSIGSGSWAPALSSGATAGSGTTSFTKANFGQWAPIYTPPTGYSYFA